MLPPIVMPPPPGPAAAPGRRPGPGRPRGSRNRRTIAVELLFATEANAVAKKAVALALEGDPTCIKLIMDRTAPVRKGARISLPNFPKVSTLEDLPNAQAYLVRAVASGRISPEEGAAVSTTLDRFSAAAEIVELKQRMAEIEERYASTR